MAGRTVSRREMIQRRRSGRFMGRRHELAVFRENLSEGAGSEGYQFLFHVRGLAGVGKSTLVRRWEELAREMGAVTAVVGDGVHSVPEAMEAISTQFGQQGCVLKGFDKHLAVYRQKQHEVDAASVLQEIAAAQGSESGASSGEGAEVIPASGSSLFIAQSSLVGLGLVPGVGALASAVNPQLVAAGMDRARAVLSARLRSADDVRLVLSPVEVLSPVLLEDLGAVVGRRPWVVLFFDTYERTAPLLDRWLRDVMVSEVYGEVPVNVVTVIAGQGRLDPVCWGDHLDLVCEVPLDVFTDDEARALLAARG